MNIMLKIKAASHKKKDTHFLKTWNALWIPGFVLCFVLFCIYISLISSAIYAGPQSTTYEIKEWGFGAGGESSIDSTSYSLFGTAGEIDIASSESDTYRTNAGLVFALQAAVPSAPAFTNPGNNYDRLYIIIDNGGNPSDSEFAIQITVATDEAWINSSYIQSDRTIGSVLGSEDWLLYEGAQGTGWGDTTGFYVTGLLHDASYKIRVKARQGSFSESAWGSPSYQSTVAPSLTFGVDKHSIAFSGLNSGNSYTDSEKSTILTTSTNAYNGYIVYAHETQPLTHISYPTQTIPDYTSPNSQPTSWTDFGFGYTTTDDTLTGGTANRFTDSGPNYAGFVTDAPGDPVADHAGPILSPIVEENTTVSYRVTALATSPAGEYHTDVIYIVVPTY